MRLSSADVVEATLFRLRGLHVAAKLLGVLRKVALRLGHLVFRVIVIPRDDRAFHHVGMDTPRRGVVDRFFDSGTVVGDESRPWPGCLGLPLRKRRFELSGVRSWRVYYIKLGFANRPVSFILERLTGVSGAKLFA